MMGWDMMNWSGGGSGMMGWVMGFLALWMMMFGWTPFASPGTGAQ